MSIAPTTNFPSRWLAILAPAMAGGMGWGIRGQYGHETGAMTAGLLVSLTIAFLFCDLRFSRDDFVRAVTLGTLAMGFGGSMTYGQTIGLTQDAPLIGNWEAFRWGMLGLAIKGSVWIGFAGVFLGMGLGGKPYRSLEMTWLMLSLIGASFIGACFFNTPHDPANHRLPLLYFSDHWYWEPDATLKHRRESWGALWMALLVTLAYVTIGKRDQLALRLGLWGIIGGAIGFPAGQCIQASHAWNPEWYSDGYFAFLTSHFNWWNMMETAFGTIMGACLGLGAWLNRHRICPSDSPSREMPISIVAGLLLVHVSMLVCVEFLSIQWIDRLYDFGLCAALLPIIATISTRRWSYLQIFPITLLPIAGKTVRHLVSRHPEPIPAWAGWIFVLAIPMLVAMAWAIRSSQEQALTRFRKPALIGCVWMYFALNFAIFDFPWPWKGITSRTPNAVLFLIASIALTIVAYRTTPGADDRSGILDESSNLR